MKKLEKTIKKRYYFFMLTIGIIIVSGVIVIDNSINSQNDDAHILNISGKQRYLSQGIDNQIFIIDRNKNKLSISDDLNKLKGLTNEFELSKRYLFTNNLKNGKNKIIDSLFKVLEPFHNKIVNSSRAILNNPEEGVIKKSLETISEAKNPFLITMEIIVNTYEKEAGIKQRKLKNTILFLAIISAIILIGEFLFVLMPAFKQLFQKNEKILEANNELSLSQNKIKANMLELTKLKTDLEIKEAYNKIFIEQAPTAIAMLDNNMCYMAVSQRWITDYKMEGREIIGSSHYDLFPEIGNEWKENHKKCLNGAIDVCDEALFPRADGSIQWIFWDVRPWYISEGNIGGLIMYTGDITHIKEKDQEKARIEKILESTNKVARIGTWELDLATDKYTLSNITCEILKVPEGFEAYSKESLYFYKEGKSRNKIIKSIKDLIEAGTSFDIELEMITLEGDTVWVRKIGQAEYNEGKCERLFGIFQDITSIKKAEQELYKVNADLKAIFNSGPIAIVSTDNNGIIKHFNHGAELLLGYSASEMVGLKEPEIYHSEEELVNFKDDIAKKYGKDPNGFNPYLELAQHDEYDTREWTYSRKNGSTFPVQLTLTAIKNDLGDKIGFLGVSYDISETKKNRDELLRKNQLLNFAEDITMMGHWQWDTVADKVIWSNNLYKIFELDEETINLKFNSYFDFVHPDDKQIVTDYFERAANDKKFHRFTHRIITTTGKIKTVQLLGEVFTNAKGEVIEMIGTGQDITQQKMAENKFRGLLESAPDAMVIVDGKGKIQLINKQAEKLFGYSAKELLEKPVEILIPERFTSNHKYMAFRDNFLSNPETRGMGHGKLLFGINKSGKEIPTQISLSPLQTEEGLLVSAAIRDITEQKLAERKIIEAKERLEVLANKLTNQNTQLADFAHITSHNLRAPVSNLNSLLDLYNVSESEEDKVILFEKFEKVIHHLTATLNTLVEAIKTKKDGSQIEDVSFDETLDKTKEILAAKIIKTGAIITNDFSKVNKISYNKIYLESIFLNLLENAIKYRSEERVPEIFIESEIEDGKIKIKFQDNGMGIDLERHGHKLFGLNKVFHRHPEAKGVGLFMAKVQIETMGGAISASSEVNKGTIFNINFN
ncbi:PAS domain S-box-containing protein [Flaviramulus basaltis]|uniref:histidine kinase n=1 Tax=Flaviramulus basaltis TaxID=369401 RepID=A0A1K2IIL5_9FLAO|nr:PAS domain S-box protein [Flaviramulus basaltis]SFZ92080.1 PAS domain S-box-containing protein [Flaviramulus basaltis]